MRFFSTAAILAFAIAAPVVLGATRLTPESVTVGRNLESIANVTLDSPAPAGGLAITLRSGDPSRLLLSTSPEGAGAPGITLTVQAGLRRSPDYYLQNIHGSGVVTYTASAPGCDSGAGTVTMAPSGVVFARPTMGSPSLRVTTGSGKVELLIYSALLDDSLQYVRPQPVAGGSSAKVNAISSNPEAGTLVPSPVTIAGGSATAVVEFQPAGPGDSQLSLSAPTGFSLPAQFATAAATVIVPGMAITDGVAIGHDLQIAGHVSLGEPAPAGGIVVTLTSQDEKALLLSASPSRAGSASIRIAIPAGGFRGSYYLQALGSSGLVAYTASAPGFRSREGAISLTPSGLVIGGPEGPPDEAELLRDDVAKGPHGFVTSLANHRPTIVTVYTVQLDPISRRGADLTVQPLRPGVSVKATLTSSDPRVGGLETTMMVIDSGASSASTRWLPTRVGSTVIAVNAPHGFTEASNCTSLSVSVTE